MTNSKRHTLSLDEALADLDLHPQDLSDPIDVNDLMQRYAQLDAQERHAREGKEEVKRVLSAFHDQGLVADKFTAHGYVGCLTKRTTYTYTKAVKELQDLEKIEGLAVEKVSTSWTLRKVES